MQRGRRLAWFVLLLLLGGAGNFVSTSHQVETLSTQSPRVNQSLQPQSQSETDKEMGSVKTNTTTEESSTPPPSTAPVVLRLGIPASDDQDSDVAPLQTVLGSRDSVQPVSATDPNSAADSRDDAVDPEEALFRVSKVIDGDTIEIQGGERVRYIGIDTPESTTQHECYGEEAKQRNRELVEGQLVRLDPDVEDRDKYGRLLRYVYLPHRQAGVGTDFINLTLVADGYANTLTIPPNVRYVNDFRAAEQQARARNLGLWNGCSQESIPKAATNNRADYDETIPQADTFDCPAQQPIKGNAQSKIYHVPGGGFYEKTKPEECFVTEQDAVAAGYRRSKR